MARGSRFFERAYLHLTVDGTATLVTRRRAVEQSRHWDAQLRAWTRLAVQVPGDCGGLLRVMDQQIALGTGALRSGRALRGVLYVQTLWLPCSTPMCRLITLVIKGPPGE